MKSHVNIALFLSLLLAAGCKNRQKAAPTPAEAPKPVVQEKPVATPKPETTVTVDRVTTLQLDPARPIDIGGWWDNGEVLLEIGYDYSYRIRRGHSQTNPIIERGRWVRGNHAEFHLEPYTQGQIEPERVALSLENGVPIATIENVKPFRKLPRPPKSVGEELEGTWRGARGTIAFDRDGKYLLETREKEAKPNAGTWQVEHGALILTPNDTASAPLVLLLQRSEKGQLIRLQDVEGPLLPFRAPRSQSQ